MLLTIIPFIADGVASDWPKAVACLERTLGSIFANPGKNLRAMVICQDKPPLNTKDERYLFLESRHPKPDKQDVMAKHRDKSDKVWEAYEAARQLAPEYVMIVDADDLISNTLVSYVHQRPDLDAFCLKTGYAWKEGSAHFTLRPRFNQVCATAFINRFHKKCFPALLGGSSKLICELGHNQVEDVMDDAGLRVDKIYEPKAVYVTGHVNHIGTFHNLPIQRRVKDLALALWRKRKLTAELRQEFGLMQEPTPGSSC
jgi:hypothetical protein